MLIIIVVIIKTIFSHNKKITSGPYLNIFLRWVLTLSSLNLPLSASSTTSRKLLSQFSTCSGWRLFELSEKIKKIAMYW